MMKFTKKTQNSSSIAHAPSFSSKLCKSSDKYRCVPDAQACFLTTEMAVSLSDRQGKRAPSAKELQALRFMAYLSHADIANAYSFLNFREEHLLNLVGLAWLEKTRVTVGQLAEQCTTVMSNNSAHRDLKHLRQRGLVALVNDPVDERRKFVEPTPLAFDYFARLGALIAEPPGAAEPSGSGEPEGSTPAFLHGGATGT